MKRSVLTYGSISGAMAVGILFATLPFIRSLDLQKADTLGYTSIVLTAILTYLGVRSYRESAGVGLLTFGRGLAVGVLITLVSTACYISAFQLVYFQVMPEFGEKFSECMVERARASGADAKTIAETVQIAQTLKSLYDKPVTNAAVTFATTFPIGLVMSALAAVILRRRPPAQQKL